MANQIPNRPKRVPIGTRNILIAEQREGYYRRWVNDIQDRLNQFKEAGYGHVTKGDADISDQRAQDPSKMGSSVVKKAVGGGMYAYLMEIPLEFYREDQSEKQAYLDKIEKDIDPHGLARDKSSLREFKSKYGPIDKD